jgi:protein-S-isoprenylcysteine O-methyltransferase Ste14
MLGSAVGSLLFLLVAPGVVAGLLPRWLTGWRVAEPAPYRAPLRLVGALFVLVGVVVLADAFIRFVVEGAGTPAPVAATERLVVGALYRFVRNPMYLPSWRASPARPCSSISSACCSTGCAWLP